MEGPWRSRVGGHLGTGGLSNGRFFTLLVPSSLAPGPGSLGIEEDRRGG